MYPGLSLAAIWPQMTHLDSVDWSVQTEVRRISGWVPPFRAAERDRWASGVRASYRPAAPVLLDLRWGWLWDRSPSGTEVSGPGDLRLGVHADHDFNGWELGGGWQVKLPNAQDEGELGSDETDALLVGTVGYRWENAVLRAQGGLDIRGDPIRFANQDDIPVAWLSGVARLGPIDVLGRVGGDLATKRSPARLETALGAAAGRHVRVGLEVSAGLTPAAANWGAGAWLGWSAIPVDLPQ